MVWGVAGQVAHCGRFCSRGLWSQGEATGQAADGLRVGGSSDSWFKVY